MNTLRLRIDDLGTPDPPAVLWHCHRGEGPLLGLAVHAGHEMRPELIPRLAIDEVTRIREEDPYSDVWTVACDTQLLTRRSRFEVDLNRPSGEAICVEPEDCWNLMVWRNPIDPALRARSLAEHRAFYRFLEAELARLEAKHGRFVVFDFHTYNHRRAGPIALPADPAANPDINIGTGSMNRTLWGPVVDGVIAALRKAEVDGKPLDVRENVNFRGRQIAAFVHSRFPETGCVLSVEVKKIFMDEWTGEANGPAITALLKAFEGAAEAATQGLRIVGGHNVED